MLAQSYKNNSSVVKNSFDIRFGHLSNNFDNTQSNSPILKKRKKSRHQYSSKQMKGQKQSLSFLQLEVSFNKQRRQMPGFSIQKQTQTLKKLSNQLNMVEKNIQQQQQRSKILNQLIAAMNFQNNEDSGMDFRNMSLQKLKIDKINEQSPRRFTKIKSSPKTLSILPIQSQSEEKLELRSSNKKDWFIHRYNIKTNHIRNQIENMKKVILQHRKDRVHAQQNLNKLCKNIKKHEYQYKSSLLNTNEFDQNIIRAQNQKISSTNFDLQLQMMQIFSNVCSETGIIYPKINYEGNMLDIIDEEKTVLSKQSTSRIVANGPSLQNDLSLSYLGPLMKKKEMNISQKSLVGKTRSFDKRQKVIDEESVYKNRIEKMQFLIKSIYTKLELEGNNKSYMKTKKDIQEQNQHIRQKIFSTDQKIDERIKITQQINFKTNQFNCENEVIQNQTQQLPILQQIWQNLMKHDQSIQYVCDVFSQLYKLGDKTQVLNKKNDKKMEKSKNISNTFHQQNIIVGHRQNKFISSCQIRKQSFVLPNIAKTQSTIDQLKTNLSKSFKNKSKINHKQQRFHAQRLSIPVTRQLKMNSADNTKISNSLQKNILSKNPFCVSQQNSPQRVKQKVKTLKFQKIRKQNDFAVNVQKVMDKKKTLAKNNILTLHHSLSCSINQYQNLFQSQQILHKDPIHKKRF